MPRKSTSYIVNRPASFPSSIGLNLAWPSYWFSEAFFKDGYSDWADTNSFNSTGANADMQVQLDIIKEHGIKYIRVWLNMYYYFNGDREDVGFTAFQNNMITSLATYYDWCALRGIKIMLVLDGGDEFPFHWVNDAKWTSYISAAVTVVNAIKDKSSAWAIDYGNENYGGWSGTQHFHNSTWNELGYDRYTLTEKYTDLYTAIKAVAPAMLCSVGSVGEPDISTFGVDSAVDFYQLHFYSSAYNSFNSPNTYTNKPMIIGECGIYGANNIYDPDLTHRIVQHYFALGYPMVFLWHFYQLVNKNAPSSYAVHQTLARFENYRET